MNQDLLNNLLDLRKRLIYIVIGILLVFLLLFRYSNWLYHIFSMPLLEAKLLSGKLIATDVTTPFFVPLKLTIICAIFISLPNTIYQLWKFLAPAMYINERLVLLFTTIAAIVLFVLGVLFCYFLVLPVLFNFIGTIKDPSIAIMTDIAKYYDFVLNLFLIFGLTFLTPIVVVLLVYFDLVSYTQFKRLRPYIFVGCFIVAAILTPPDVLSQILLALPLYILYEVGLFCGRYIKCY
jgi:sec-independent protein translocase protein TatC